MVLKKDVTLYERNDNNELIPQEVVLSMTDAQKAAYPDLVGQKVWITPLSRGELKDLFGEFVTRGGQVGTAKRDTDAEVLLKHCHNPKYEESDIPFIKPYVLGVIVHTILEESGVRTDTKGASRIESDEFGKNS